MSDYQSIITVLSAINARLLAAQKDLHEGDSISALSRINSVIAILPTPSAGNVKSAKGK